MKADLSIFDAHELSKEDLIDILIDKQKDELIYIEDKYSLLKHIDLIDKERKKLSKEVKALKKEIDNYSSTNIDF